LVIIHKEAADPHQSQRHCADRNKRKYLKGQAGISRCSEQRGTVGFEAGFRRMVAFTVKLRK
jgi:hypothetical protein